MIIMFLFLVCYNHPDSWVGVVLFIIGLLIGLKYVHSQNKLKNKEENKNEFKG